MVHASGLVVSVLDWRLDGGWFKSLPGQEICKIPSSPSLLSSTVYTGEWEDQEVLGGSDHPLPQPRVQDQDKGIC